jgi:hypothetical protein
VPSRANFIIPTRRFYKEFNFDAPSDLAGLFLILYNYPPKHLKLDLTLFSSFPWLYWPLQRIWLIKCDFMRKWIFAPRSVNKNQVEKIFARNLNGFSRFMKKGEFRKLFHSTWNLRLDNVWYIFLWSTKDRLGIVILNQLITSHSSIDLDSTWRQLTLFG